MTERRELLSWVGNERPRSVGRSESLCAQEKVRAFRVALLPLMLLVFPVLQGCDSCGGIGMCGGPLIRYSGRVLKAPSQAPAEGIRVDFVPTGGTALEEPLLTATTDR